MGGKKAGNATQIWYGFGSPCAPLGLQGEVRRANDRLTQLGDDLRPLEVGVQRRREAMLLDNQQRSTPAADGLGSASIPLVRKPSASCVLPTTDAARRWTPEEGISRWFWSVLRAQPQIKFYTDASWRSEMMGVCADWMPLTVCASARRQRDFIFIFYLSSYFILS